MREVTIPAADAGQRLDRYLRKLLRDLPLGAIFRHLRTGAIRVDGKKAEPKLRLVAGMTLQLRLRESAGEVPPAAARAAAKRPEWRGPEPRIVHRDADVLVVDKPAGMAVQGGSGQGEDHLAAWVDSLAVAARSATFRPSPAHRIDRGTSGLCAIGLSPAGLRGLAAAFRDGTARKVYVAVVHGVPTAPGGTIDLPLRERDGASADEPKVEVHRDGKPARTDYEVVQRGRDRALLRLRLHTGRMHQIRAHLAHLGHPIVGDRRYGSPVRMGTAFLLHAAELRLPHPVHGAELQLVAPLPPGFQLDGAAAPEPR